MKAIRFQDTSDYQYLRLMGQEGAFTPLRIQRESLPDGFYKYSFRDGEESFLGSVSKDILVNHAGDYITKTPLDLGIDEEKELREEDFFFEDKEFDFEDFFGAKLSIDCQIEMAEEKRNQQTNPSPAKEKDSIHENLPE